VCEIERENCFSSFFQCLGLAKRTHTHTHCAHNTITADIANTQKKREYESILKVREIQLSLTGKNAPKVSVSELAVWGAKNILTRASLLHTRAHTLTHTHTRTHTRTHTHNTDTHRACLIRTESSCAKMPRDCGYLPQHTHTAKRQSECSCSSTIV